jgi:hypothetical protein
MDTTSHATDPPGSGPGTRQSSAEAIARNRLAIAATLARIRRTARFWIWVESLSLLLLLAAGYFWATLILDRLLEPPPAVRAAALGAVAMALLVVATRRLVGRMRAALADRELALLVERRDPTFRDSLATAVHAAAADSDEPVDEALVARSTALARDQLDRLRIGDLFNTASLMSVVAVAAVVAGGIGWFSSVAPDVTSLWARRMVLLSQERWPRATRLSVEGFPDGVRRVARGSDVDILVRADASGRVPEAVELRSRSADGSTTDRMGRRGGQVEGRQAFGHVLVDVRRDLELSIRGGDDRIDGLRLVAVDPPSVESLEIGFTPPAYLGSRHRSVRPAGLVEIPRGSTVRIGVTADKPLSRGTIRGRQAIALGRDAPEGSQASEDCCLASLDDAIGPAATDGGGEGHRGGTPAGASPLEGRRLEAAIEDLEGVWTIMVDMADRDGVATPRPTAFRIVAVDDAPPQLVVSLLGVSSMVTPGARVPLVGTIRDDHGLASAAVVVRRGPAAVTAPTDDERPLGPSQARPSPPSSAAVSEHRFPIDRLVTDSPLVELPESSPESVDLEPLGLEPGETLLIEVTASDACGLAEGPHAVRSDAWTLEVVSAERLSSMLEARELVLRRRFERVVEEFAAAREPMLAAAEGLDSAGAGAADNAPETPTATAPDVVRLLVDAADRCRGETAEIAAAFLEIRREFDNNRLLTDELDTRLFAQIAGPLSEIADGDLPLLAAACRRVRAADLSTSGAAALAEPSAAVLARMREVLARMLELETFNEVVEILRSSIRTQEGLREETIRRQKERARAVLEGE